MMSRSSRGRSSRRFFGPGTAMVAILFADAFEYSVCVKGVIMTREAGANHEVLQDTYTATRSRQSHFVIVT